MFLAKDNAYGTTYLVFTHKDPRRSGFRGEVVEDVELDYDVEAFCDWPEGDGAQAFPM